MANITSCIKPRKNIYLNLHIDKDIFIIENIFCFFFLIHTSVLESEHVMQRKVSTNVGFKWLGVSGNVKIDL